jgi:hypothetical protein
VKNFFLPVQGSALGSTSRRSVAERCARRTHVGRSFLDLSSRS